MVVDRELFLKQMYNNILAQAISASGKFLFAGNRFGDIFVQDLSELEKTEEPRAKPMKFTLGHGIEVNSMCFHRDFLVVGAIGCIFGLAWDEDERELSIKRKWEVKVPMRVDAIEVPDVNSMWLRPETDILYIGCGDNNIYQVSLEDGRIVRDYCGHTDYIHGVTGAANGCVYSASEDGTVRMWCDNETQSTNILEPSKQIQLMRPEYGKWLGAVAANNDWLLCGGGPKLSIWHLRSLECMGEFPFPGTVHVCDFVEEKLFVAGEHDRVQFYEINGDILADIPVEHTAVYSVAWRSEPPKFMSIAGYSNRLHILNDLRFIDSKIDLYYSLDKHEVETTGPNDLNNILSNPITNEG